MSAMSGETSQTLDRGLTVLSLLAMHSDGLTAAELAEELSTARAVVYRLLRTLEAHRLVGRIDTRYVLGFGVAELASRLRPRLQTTVLPILRRLSQQTNSTALLSVADGDQALVLITEEPPESTLHLAMRQGARQKNAVACRKLKGIVAYFKIIFTFYYIKHFILVRVYMQRRALALGKACLLKQGKAAVGIAAAYFQVKHIGIYAFKFYVAMQPALACIYFKPFCSTGAPFFLFSTRS